MSSKIKVDQIENTSGSGDVAFTGTGGIKLDTIKSSGGTSAITIASNGNIALSSGNIDFSANAGTAKSGATTTSELLNHYEQGTWAPILQGSTSNPTYSTSGGHATGKFVRIGNLVYIQWSMQISSVASQGSGNARLSGLPYVAVCQTYEGHIGVMYNDIFSNETQKGYVSNGNDFITLVPTGITQTNFGVTTLSTGYFGGGGHYLVG